MSRPVRLLLVLAGTLIILASPLSALAQDETIGGTLVYRAADERTPVEGVTISVSQDGTEIGSAVSDAEGRWEVPLPGPGTYQVTLEVTTLPEGVGLTDPTKVELPNVNVLSGQRRSVIFPLGEGGVVGPAVYGRIGALLVAGFKLGATIALAAVGLSLIYGVTRLVNFAHAELVTLGAVLAYAFHAPGFGPSLPLVLASIPAVILVAGFGGLQSRYLWRPLRKRGTALLSLMVVSIGLSFALRSLIQLTFGGQPVAYPDFAGQPAIPVLGIPMVPKHLVTIGVTIVILFLVTQFLQRSRAGTAMRAVADDRDLAESSGINVDRVIHITWILAAFLAALGGVFYGLNESVSYEMGFRILLLLFAAVVLGGLGTAYGVMVGGFVVGIVVEMSTLVLPAELKVVSGLLILIVMLLVRPQGIFGSRERIG
ncbi:MAG TPA: branched-chain amino acid ABC transporter permease [Acidimicrobiia bacterium]|nr:branched-chain amino acid ABC transporter permease [Acidimicrobiia bacterium]